ncbi:MAG: CHASE2 domain-containing protein, partial [Microcystaceae cyanobacterium]
NNTVRRQLLSLKPDLTDHCSTDLSFNFLIALDYLDRMQKGIKVEYLEKQGWKIGSLVLPQLSDRSSGYQGVDSQGSQVMLNYRSYSSPNKIARQISLREVLQGGISAALVNQLQQPIVLIGVTARGENYDDFFNTPYGEEIPGVFLQAQAISQIISAVLDKRPLIWWWPWPVEAVWIGWWSVLGGMLAWSFQEPLKRRLSIGIALTGLGGICLVIFTQAGWVPLVPPALALVATAVGVRWWSTSHSTANSKQQ